MIFINHKLVNGMAVAALVGCTIIGGSSIAVAKVSAPATMVAYNTSQEGAEHLRDGYVDRAAWQEDFDAKAQEAQGVTNELQGLTAYLTQEQKDKVAGFNVDGYATIAELQAYIDEASSWKVAAEIARDEANSKAQVEVETSPASSGSTSAPTYSGGNVDLMSAGVVNWGGYRFTWYSQNVLPGGGLNIPGRHVNGSGFVCDGDGYIVAATAFGRGTTGNSPWGAWKSYDTGVSGNTVDLYTSW